MLMLVMKKHLSLSLQRCCNLRLHWERRKRESSNHHSNLSALFVFHHEGWTEIFMRQGCSRLTVTARNVHPPLQRCKRHFPEKDLASPDDFD
ncbi:hypothetical protein CEXT_746761 [Caerostris extrusa]|uniref:Secreted protein n=1 Tax=Caerostris extrusa TaxID=172846 RepID=A0AAV4WZV8_CAEEX|nr:hypothetical protein CEXT_746761 [Caerostris extrusa]